MKYEHERQAKKIISKSLAILSQVVEAIDEGLYFISLDKLKRETSYLDGDPRRLSNNIYSLERSGYIKIDRKNASVELTNKGRKKILEHSEDQKTDEKWRFLSWDIPEELAIKRQQFCRSIRRIGYKPVQKSLWASPFVRSDEVYLVIDELGIRKYVAYIVSGKTDIDIDLKKLFPRRLS